MEEQAKLKVTNEMIAMLSVLPSEAHMMMELDSDGNPTTLNVPYNTLCPGEVVFVLPGVYDLFMTS